MIAPRANAPAAALLGFLMLVGSGCAERPPRVLGDGCELTVECASPLVCRLGACREECRQARDCRPGLTCVRDAARLGVCQLESESDCALNSDCPEGLVCRFEQCTNRCVNDRDCISGSSCVPDMPGGTELACRDLTEVECRNHSDCGSGLVCARDLRCRPECRADRDCRDSQVCDLTLENPACMLPNPLMRPPATATFEAGGGTTCVVDVPAAGDLSCFGDNTSGQVGDGTAGGSALPANTLVGTSVLAVDVGSTHACAIDAEGLKCWGEGADGQLGLGPTTTSALSPTIVPGMNESVGLALAVTHTCAWTATEARCWGRNEAGQLGDGTLAGRSEPGPPIPRVAPVVHAAAGESHTCAVRDDGTLFCWGDNTRGQLGDGGFASSAVPVRSLVSDVVQVVAGRGHTCALRRDRQVRCWGENASGQTGNGATGVAVGVVIPVDLGPVVQIAAGEEHTCVLEADGVVKCFGTGADGQLGAAVGSSTTPLSVSLPTLAGEVRAGERFTCVLDADRTASFCFGDNSDGQFGETVTGGPMPREIVW